MKIESAQHVYLGNDDQVLPKGPGRPALQLVVDGRDVLILADDQKLLAHGYDLVFLGADWEEQLPVVKFPGDAARGLDPQELRGFTTDGSIVRLARSFHADVMDGAFTPGRVQL